MNIKEFIESKREELSKLESEINELIKADKPEVIKLYYLTGLFAGCSTTLNALEDVNE